MVFITIYPRTSIVLITIHKKQPLNVLNGIKSIEIFWRPYLSPGQTRLGNNVAETYCFLSMFFSLPTPVNIVLGTKFASREAKMFPNKFRNNVFQISHTL
jgi:hypothetical protein